MTTNELPRFFMNHSVDHVHFPIHV